MQGERGFSQLPALTGARWLAAFAVFLHHAGLAAYLSARPQSWLVGAFGAGHVGVSFFFVLSGFVLMWSHRDGERAAAFWWRRVARVVPAHVVTALIALALGLTVATSLGPRSETGGWPATGANLVLLNAWVPGWSQAGNPVSWSLVCEAFFYAAFPAGAFVLARRGVQGAWVALAGAVVAAGVAALVIDLSSADVSRVPLVRLPEFVAGVAAARLVQLNRWPTLRLPVALGAVVLGWLVVGLIDRPYAVALVTLPGFVVLIAAIAADQASGRRGAPLVRGLSHPLLVRLGEWSFAFYLVHVLVMRVLEHTVISHPELDPLPGLGLLATVLLVSIAMAAALHHLVEAPANALIRSLTQRGGEGSGSGGRTAYTTTTRRVDQSSG